MAHYAEKDWPLFLGGEDSGALRKLQRRFTLEVDKYARAVDDTGEFEVAIPDHSGEEVQEAYEERDEDRDAYLTFASITGHGVGLWEHREPHHFAMDSFLNWALSGSRRPTPTDDEFTLDLFYSAEDGEKFRDAASALDEAISDAIYQADED